MNIREKENELFKRWREHSGVDENTFFVQDGTLDPEAYSSASIKICTILKETPVDESCLSGYTFDISKRVKEGNGIFKFKGKDTLKNTSRWISLIKGILFQTDFKLEKIEFFPHPLKTQDHLNDLFSSAYINIKKYNGNKFSTPADLKRVAIKDRSYLIEQLDIVLRPDIVLAGGTFAQYKILYPTKLNLIIEKFPIRIWEHVEENISRLIFELYHPTFRENPETYFNLLKSALDDLKSSDNFFKFIKKFNA